MTLEYLQAITTFYIPYAASAVARRGDDLIALRIERDFGDLALVSYQDGLTRARLGVVHARCEHA